MANFLEQLIHATIKDWLKMVDDDTLLLTIRLDDKIGLLTCQTYSS